jgi:hypothetical protein
MMIWNEIQDTRIRQKGNLDSFGTTKVPEVSLHPIVPLHVVLQADDLDVGACAKPPGITDAEGLKGMLQIHTRHLKGRRFLFPLQPPLRMQV